MFKKPLSNLKTSAPLRSSDRRKFKQRVVQSYALQPEDGDSLVPEGLLSQKFHTHVKEPGVVYLSPEGDPLWFSLGKDSDALIPTVYLLWKRPDLLPTVSTPAAVVPKLVDGADLMIPGVVEHSAELVSGQLVAITQYHRDMLGPPLAVGRMAVSADTLRRADAEDTKGKAVYVLHTWKDCLWDLGPSKKMEIPAPRDPPPPPAPQTDKEDQDVSSTEETNLDPPEPAHKERDTTANDTDAQHGEPQCARPSLLPEEVSSCLRSAVLQAISTTLGALPSSSYPIPASLFWSNYILPARPALVTGVNGLVDANAVDIKHSTYKTVKTFLKACAKEDLLKLKETKGDVVVTGVSPKHPAVAGHTPYRTLQSVEAQREKAEQRERKEKEAQEKRNSQIQILELWKPHGPTVGWFVAAEVDTSELYPIPHIRDIFIKYITSKNLINSNDQQYINVSEDELLWNAVSTKKEDNPEFLKRDDCLNRIRANMQEWYEMRTEGGDTVRKKGQVKPISIEAKVRQGRKTSTFITGFEHFGLDANELAEELRKACASSTAVSPLPGKGAELEVMVQGVHTKTVTDILVAKGVPVKWIKSSGLKDKKK